MLSKPSPGPLLLTKVFVMLALAGAVAHNCKSPHLLDAAAGDTSAEPAVRLPFAASAWKLVGHLHLSWGLPAVALGVVTLAGWFCLAPGSPARQPWRRSEAAAAVACAAGAALRAWCFHELGPLFTYEVGIRQVRLWRGNNACSLTWCCPGRVCRCAPQRHLPLHPPRPSCCRRATHWCTPAPIPCCCTHHTPARP